MRIAFLSPLPPTRSGISVYSAMLLPALGRRVELVAVDELPRPNEIEGVPVLSLADYASRRDEFDAAIYQMGNNPYHEWIYREAFEKPGFIVLHDLILHHLIVEMTLARGLTDEYVAIMTENHGAVGEAWARGRIAGYHNELGNFLLPGSRHIAQSSRGIIVHNEYAAGRLRAMGVDRPITVAPMSFEASIDLSGEIRNGKRKELGFGVDLRVIGMFGFVTASKRPEKVLEAFSESSKQRPDLRLLIVGEPAPNCDLAAMIRHFDVDPSRVHATGFVSDESFDAFLAASDRVVNLRYPTAGETSGALLRIFAAGRPVAVSDLAQFTEFPAEVATRIPLGDGEIAALSEFMLADDDGVTADAQRRWLEENAQVRGSVDAYIEAITRSEAIKLAPDDTSPLPLFPQLRLERVERSGGRLSIHLRNLGDSNLRAAVFGTPGYRMIVKLFAGEREVLDRWIAPEEDLKAGEGTVLHLNVPDLSGGVELRLHHALEGVPVVDETPFAVSAVPGVSLA